MEIDIFTQSKGTFKYKEIYKCRSCPLHTKNKTKSKKKKQKMIKMEKTIIIIKQKIIYIHKYLNLIINQNLSHKPSPHHHVHPLDLRPCSNSRSLSLNTPHTLYPHSDTHSRKKQKKTKLISTLRNFCGRNYNNIIYILCVQLFF